MTSMDEKRVVKGRGATQNPTPRYDRTVSVPVDDGWDAWEDECFPEVNPATVFLPDQTRNIIATNESPDIPFNQSINPYKGCEHGCVYCYARPTHAYLDLSPGLDFETKIFYKTNPVERLTEALNHPRYQCQTIAMGTNTDPYQPGERQHRITRRVLETMLEFRHPVSIVTKGALILRDLDLLEELAKLHLVSVAVSVTTLSLELKTKLEPRTASPSTRLRMVEKLYQAKVPVGVMMAPIIPFLNDEEIEDVVERSADAGAAFVGYVMLRLPLEVEGLFTAWLDEHYPLKAERIMGRVRDMRRGKAYQAKFGERMRGTGIYADLIARRFQLARKRHNLERNRRPPTTTKLFRPRRKQRELF